MKKRLKKKGRFSAVKKVVKAWYYHEIDYFCAVHNIKTNHINIKRATTHYMTKYLGNSDKLIAAYLTVSLSQPSMSAPHLLAAKKNRSEVK
jgi:hypothetical protein